MSSFHAILIIVLIIATAAAIHFMRPDISHSLTAFVSQKYRDFTPTVIVDGMAAAGDSLKGLYDDLMLQVDGLWSLPWQKYYDQAVRFARCFVSWSAALEERVSKAGHPGWGRFVHIGLYFGVILLVGILVALIRWILNTIWAVITGAIGIVWALFTWILYPFGFIFGLFYRLLFGRN